VTKAAAGEHLAIEVQDIEPIKGTKALGAIRPGVNVFRGRNGSGKSTCIRLVEAASSTGRIKAGDFEVVAGASRGRLRYGGRTLTVERGGGGSRRGDAPAAEPLGAEFRRLDDPGVAGAEPRRDERLRSICKAAGVEPTADNLRRLLPVEDEAGWSDVAAVAETVLAGFSRVPPTSLPAAAKTIKAAVQKRRQAVEADLAVAADEAKLRADRAQRAAAALEAEAGEELAEAAAADVRGKAEGGGVSLEQQRRAAADQLARTRAEFAAGQRGAAERKVLQEQLAAVVVDDRAVLLEKQQLAKAAWETAADAADAAYAQILALEREKTTHLAEKAEQARVLADLERRIAAAEQQQARAAELQAKLAAAAPREVGADDVDQAEADLVKVERLIGYRDRLDAIARLEAEAAAAEQQRAELEALAGRIDAVDGAVWRRLGGILAEALTGDVRVNGAGVVEVQHLGEWRDLDSTAFSEGQRLEKILEWAIRAAVPGRAITFEGDCPIDDDRLRELSPLAAKAGVSLVLEKEQAGAELHLTWEGA
jgi:hypothetical protein